MSRNKKNLIFCLIVLAALAAVFFCWRNNGKGTPYYAETADFQTIEPSVTRGYEIDGYHYLPMDGDPQICYVIPQPETIESVIVSFDRPIPAGTAVQLFFARDGQEFAERRSVVISPQQEAEELIADLPQGVYQSLRLDIDGEFFLQQVQTCDRDPKYSKASTDYLQLVFELCFVTLFLLVIRWKLLGTEEWQQSKLVAAAGKLIHKQEHLSHTERWYLLLCFVMCLFWSCVFLSIGYGPDETMRYDIPHFIYETGTLPYGGEPSLIHPIWGISYGFSISLPYLISALFMRIVSFYTNAGFMLLIAARFTSVLSYTGIVYYSIRIGKKAFSGSIRWIFIFVMSLTPEVVFLGSYVDLDSFALFTVMMIIDSWLDCMKCGWDRRSCLKLGFAAGLCLISYKFAYSYLVGSVLLYCLWYAKNRKTVSFGRFVAYGAIIVGVAFLISGWYFIRNAIIYDGDFLSLNSGRPYAEQYALPEYRPSTKMTMAKQGYSILGMLLYTNWVRTTLFSFVSVLGGMNIFAHKGIYLGFLILFGTGMLLGIPGVFSKGKNSFSACRIPVILSMMISSMITIGISIYYSWSYDFQPQGRYIIYALPFVACLTTVGYQWATEIAERRFPTAPVKLSAIKLTGTFLVISLAEAFLHCVEAFLPSWR